MGNSLWQEGGNPRENWNIMEVGGILDALKEGLFLSLCVPIVSY